MSAIVQYNFPTTTKYGPGARRLLPEVLQGRRPLVVTDAGIAQLPILGELVQLLESAGLKTTVYSGVVGNPVKSQVTAGVEAFKAGDCDALVGLGGGAALDVAKAIALMANHPGDLFDYEDGKLDARSVDQEIPFLAAIPTTAGTGSEVGRSTVISDDQTHQKKIMFSPRLMPPIVLMDPELTLGLPAGVTATTGMDALTHLIESYLAQGYQPLCDGIALEGLRLVERSLRQCVAFARAKAPASPEHLEARGLMLNAAMMGAVAFQKGLGAVHSCAHALSTVCDLHHGLANGIMLPYLMRFNQPAVEERLATMARAVGAGDTAGSFIAWIEALKAEIGVPAKLSEAGVKPQHLEALVNVAEKDVCHQLNPRPVSRADFAAIFREALGA